MRCEFGVFENRQSDNVGDNKTPSDEDDADAQEGISKLDSAKPGLRFEAVLQLCAGEPSFYSKRVRGYRDASLLG
jgi:hypothetical protein